MAKFSIDPILNGFDSSNSGSSSSSVCSHHSLAHLLVDPAKVYRIFCSFSSSLNCSKNCISRRGEASLDIAIVPFTTFGLPVSECIHSVALFTAFVPRSFVIMTICKVVNAKTVDSITKVLTSVSIPIPEMVTTKPKNTLHKNPLYQKTHSTISLQFKEKILCLEIMGVDSGRALTQNPSLHAAPLQSIHAVVTFLRSKGIHLKDLGRIFGMCPQILTSDVKSDLAPIFTFLSHDLRVPDDDFRKVINKCPRFLASDVADQLKPALSYLNKLGFTDLHALAYQDPILLVSNVEKTLVPKMDYLLGLGFSKSDAVGMVRRCPGLFTFSIANNFNPKFEYFSEEMNGKLEQLREFPQYFAFSLEKRIKPRHLEVVHSGVKVALPLMLKSTDVEFRELLKQGSG